MFEINEKDNVTPHEELSEHIVLYSHGCPKCKVLEQKLKSKNIEYDVCSDVETMIAMGMVSAPNLQVGGELMDFSTAIKWVNERK